MKAESIAQPLDAWLARLDAEGFSLGVRERLVAHRLLITLALDTSPTGTPQVRSLREMLETLAPILCTSPESQRRYASLLEEFLQSTPRRGRSGATRSQISIRRDTRGSRAALVGIALLLIGTLWVGGALRARAPVPKPSAVPAIVDDPGFDPERDQDDGRRAPFIAPLPLVLETLKTPIVAPLDRTAQWTVLGAACACLVGLGARSLIRQRSRRAALAHAKSDRELTERVLTSERSAPTVPRPPLVRAAARSLRQRVAGRRLEFDLRATTAASIRAGGAFAPRYRASQTTPEYLVLVERTARNDHFSAIAERMLSALRERDVTFHVYSHDGSPERGCWRPRTNQSDDRPPERASFGELAARHDGCRLIVFGRAEAAMDPLSGEPRTWTRDVRSFPARAWFSPMPMAAWGTAETVADALGFLVLPTQWEAIATLADWFSSESLILKEGDWPANYPECLIADGLGWVARATRPAEAEVATLVGQLRGYLGPVGFQWLCACATFPALSPPLTEAFGELVVTDDSGRAAGHAALASLPWFRLGGMQSWLRSELLGHLRPDLVTACRDLIARRLNTALVDQPGQALASVFVERGLDAMGWQRLTAWLDRRSPMARDALLVRLFRSDQIDTLAQELPRTLQRAILGGQLGVVLRQHGRLMWQTALLAIVTTIAFVAAAPERPIEPREGDPTPTVTFGGVGVTCAVFTPDGGEIVTGHSDGAIRRWTRRGEPLQPPIGQDDAPIQDLLFSLDGSRLASASQSGSTRVWETATRKQRIVLRVQAPRVRLALDGARFFDIVESSATITSIINPFAPLEKKGELLPPRGFEERLTALERISDERGIVGGESGGVAVVDLQTWEADLSAKGVHPSAVSCVAIHEHSDSFASAGVDGSVRVLSTNPDDVLTPMPLDGHLARVSTLRFSPDGRSLCSASDDHTSRVWLDGIDGVEVLTLKHGTAFVDDARFSPDGSQVLTRTDDGVLRLWGRQPPVRIELLSCGEFGGIARSSEEMARVLTSGAPDREPQSPPATSFAQSPGASAALIDAAVVVYPIETWLARGNEREPPREGEILFNPKNAAHESAARRLESLFRSGALGEEIMYAPWRMRPAERPLDAIVVNLCTLEGRGSTGSRPESAASSRPQEQNGLNRAKR